MSEKAPIAFFAYNRPEHTKRSLESLSKCEGAAESELFIFCDGPKKPEDEEAVKEVRALLKNRKWCGKVNIIERDENMGLANSIISGVTETVNRYERIIVLEDDLILSPQFLNYMNDALEIYKDNPRVMHISGYMFPVREKLPETFFYRVASCWGWATWKRAWDRFENDPNKLMKDIEKTGRKWDFNINGSYVFYNFLLEQAAGKLDSWAIPWYASVFLADGLCLHPGRSLVQNIGYDGSGIHCENSDEYDVDVSNERIVYFTREIRECEEAVNMMVAFYSSPYRAFYCRVLNKLKQTLLYPRVIKKAKK